MPDDLDLVAHLHDPALDPARHHRAAARNREDVLDRHQERLVHVALRHRNVAVQRLVQLQDRFLAQRTRIARQRLDRRAADHRRVVARETGTRQQLPHLQLHQVQQLRIVHHVALVQEHHDVRHAHLPRQQDVLPRLRHRTVHRRHHQDRAVHLRRSGDHVLHVVRVTRAVDVRVVTVRRRVLDVRRRDRQDLRRVATALRLRGLRHFVVRHELRPALVRGHLRQRRRQRRLPMVHVTDRSYVHVRLRTIELFLRHGAPIASSDQPCPRSGRFVVRLRNCLAARISDSATAMEPTIGLEPMTSSLPRKCSTAELRGRRLTPGPAPHPADGGSRSAAQPSTLDLAALSC